MSKFSKSVVYANICMALACVCWGLMAPVGKDAMSNGIGGGEMVTFRAVGGAVCFWLMSFFMSKEIVALKDKFLFFFAGMFAIVFNQCCFTVGLSITSPVNASIMTTTMPIATIIFATVILKEPLTLKKVLGVLLGALGALTLIVGSSNGVGSLSGDLLGDVLCVCAQISFALYLTLFKKLIARYSVVTCMKYMISCAAIVILPFTIDDMCSLPWRAIKFITWLETGFVVVFGTFLAYILMMKGQKTLRPTVVSMYNYAQPIISCLVSVMFGLGVFGLNQMVAIVLVFVGVFLVNASKKAVPN